MLGRWAVDARATFVIPQQKRATAHAHNGFHSPVDGDDNAHKAMVYSDRAATCFPSSVFEGRIAVCN